MDFPGSYIRLLEEIPIFSCHLWEMPHSPERENQTRTLSTSTEKAPVLSASFSADSCEMQMKRAVFFVASAGSDSDDDDDDEEVIFVSQVPPRR